MFHSILFEKLMATAGNWCKFDENLVKLNKVGHSLFNATLSYIWSHILTSSDHFSLPLCAVCKAGCGHAVGILYDLFFNIHLALLLTLFLKQWKWHQILIVKTEVDTLLWWSVLVLLMPHTVSETVGDSSYSDSAANICLDAKMYLVICVTNGFKQTTQQLNCAGFDHFIFCSKVVFYIIGPWWCYRLFQLEMFAFSRRMANRQRQTWSERERTLRQATSHQSFGTSMTNCWNSSHSTSTAIFLLSTSGRRCMDCK